MTTNEIKKGMKIKSVQLGVPVTGIMLDNARGNTRLVDVKGSEVGMFDEMGSIYAHDITLVEVDGRWVDVTHTERQLKLKESLSNIGWQKGISINGTMRNTYYVWDCNDSVKHNDYDQQ